MDPAEIKNIDSLTVTVYGLIAYSGMLKYLVIYFYNKSQKNIDSRINELIERVRLMEEREKEKDAKIITLQNENYLLKELKKQAS